MADEIAGFRTTICVKLNENSCSHHVMYYKKHSVREEESIRPTDKTLFVLNVPPYCTKSALKRLFEACGAVQNVYLLKQPGKVRKTKASLVNSTPEIEGFKVAYIVFKKSSSLDTAMELNSSEIRVLSDEQHPVHSGMKKWCHEYSLRYPNPIKLQEEVDKFMSKFDKAEEQAKKAEYNGRGKPDDEGWITVGKGGRKPAGTKIDAAELQERRKKKKKALVNFYQFQQRESRREHIAQLRKKFDEDKKKIANMKASRKFKPY